MPKLATSPNSKFLLYIHKTIPSHHQTNEPMPPHFTKAYLTPSFPSNVHTKKRTLQTSTTSTSANTDSHGSPAKLYISYSPTFYKEYNNNII